LPPSVFDGFKDTAAGDRYAWFKCFFDNVHNVAKLHGNRISDESFDAGFQVATRSSAHATLACIDTWLTDFRPDLAELGVLMLVVQGTRGSHPSHRRSGPTPSGSRAAHPIHLALIVHEFGVVEGR
jgi:hypothetical protein